MQKTRLLLTFILCIAAILLLVGCNILDNLIKEGGSSAPLGQILNRKPAGDDALPVITAPEQGEKTVKLYFADKSGKKLVEVTRTIPKTLSLARETASQWLLGPAGGASDSYPSVNPQTVLRDINIKSGIATVDLSKEFLEPYSNVSAETTLYGLVNTVSQFSTVQIVKIRVEGKDIKTYRGINLNELRFRNDLVGFTSSAINPSKDDIQIDGLQATEHQEDNKTAAGADKKTPEGPGESPSSINLFVK